MRGVVPRVYCDTSVFGGVFDREFMTPSRAFFQQVRNGRFSLVTSDMVRREIAAAPSEVQRYYLAMLPLADVVSIGSEADRLQTAYVQAGVVSPKWAADALHVALASVNACSLIVSWNFSHIVHFGKIPRYNAVNALNGLGAIAIHSPLEVVGDED
jgi:predicted nucleic acid-binding protein